MHHVYMFTVIVLSFVGYSSEGEYRYIVQELSTSKAVPYVSGEPLTVSDTLLISTNYQILNEKHK